MESDFDRELFIANWELQINACHLSDVRDAFKQCYLEWDRLQEERRGILSRIVELEQVKE